MKEYFVIANSFAAPFFSDTSESYIKGKNPLDAMNNFVKKYSHPCGLYSANLYASADDYHKNKKRLAFYLSNTVIEKERLTKGLSGYSFLHDHDEKGEYFKIDGEKHYIKSSTTGECFLEPAQRGKEKKHKNCLTK